MFKKQDYRVPILMYHYIRDYQNNNDIIGTNLSVSIATFTEQIKVLSNENFQPILFADLLNPSSLPPKPIILTFDDGYVDAYNVVFQLLKQYQFTATFYIVINFLNTKGYLTTDQVIEMANNGMNIASHTLNHPDLTVINKKVAYAEILNSKVALQNLGINSVDFAYPSGKYNHKIIRLVKKAGYQTAVTTHFGIATNKNSLLELPRLRIHNTHLEDKFLHLINHPSLWWNTPFKTFIRKLKKLTFRKIVLKGKWITSLFFKFNS